jgi:nucleolar protein 53
MRSWTTEFGAGSAVIDVSAAVKHSGSYDPWVPEEVEDIADGLEHAKKPKIKASTPFTAIGD